MAKKVFIVGLNSFIGSHLKNDLEQKGHEVSGTTRRRDSVGGKTFYFDFSNPQIDSSVFQGIDWVVYCAHDVAFNDLEAMKKSLTMIYQAAHQAGVKNHLFPSTAGITEGVDSAYIQAKNFFEDFFLAKGGQVFRLGLVWGNGGLSGKIRALTLKLPLSVLIGGGKVRFAVVGLSDVLEIFGRQIEGSLPQDRNPFHLFHPQRYSLKQIVKTVCEVYGKRFFYVSVPLWPLLTCAKVVEFFHIKLPFSSASLQRFKMLPVETEVSDLPQVPGFQAKSLRQIMTENR